MKKGVALAYDGEVPRIVARAAGELYERLLEIAREHGITIYEDPDLVEVLSAMETGSAIPPDLYRSVAEVLALCYRVNRDFRDKVDGLGV